MTSFPKFDDNGSFPLPENIEKSIYYDYYWKAYKALGKGFDIFEHLGFKNYTIKLVLDTLKLKMKAGLEVVNYPQLVDMYTQFLKPLNDYQEDAFLIEKQFALILEVKIIEHFSKEIFEQTDEKIRLRVCVTGPIELYIRERGFMIYKDIALRYATTVNRFLKNSLLDTKYIITETVALDEPSFGLTYLTNTNEDELIEIFDKSLEGIHVDNQIHLHTSNAYQIPLRTKNIGILMCEHSSDDSKPVPKQELEDYDKFMRIGICRTNLDNLFAEALEKGLSMEYLNTTDGLISLIDSKERIKKVLLDGLNRYGDRLKYIGPDCALAGWGPPRVACSLLERVHEVIENVKKEWK